MLRPDSVSFPLPIKIQKKNSPERADGQEPLLVEILDGNSHHYKKRDILKGNLIYFFWQIPASIHWQLATDYLSKHTPLAARYLPGELVRSGFNCYPLTTSLPTRHASRMRKPRKAGAGPNKRQTGSKGRPPSSGRMAAPGKLRRLRLFPDWASITLKPQTLEPSCRQASIRPAITT